MSKSYVIQWKSTVNGRAGKGTKLFEFDEATQLAEELNEGYPGIVHEVIENNSSPPAGVPEPAEPAEQLEPGAEVVNVHHSADLAFSA